MRTPFQKAKLLKILDILEHESDENHPLNAEDINQRIARDLGEEYVVDRRSLTKDVEALVEAGYDIESRKGHGGGYYMASREFELPEVKLLADAVSASRFITEEKARSLLTKLGGLTNVYEAKNLKRQVVVQNRTKTDNEKIYYIVDAISQAIEEDRAISFQYTSYNIEKKKVLRHDGKTYVVSPAFLLWDNENYYLVAYDHDEEEIRHYRVDRMTQATVLEEPREGKDVRSALNRSDYTRRNFGMFAGNERTVRLEFEESLTDVLIDRFGTDTNMHRVPGKAGYAQAIIDVQISNQFFGWLTGLGSRIELVGPEDVREKYREYLAGIMGMYNAE